MTQLYPHQQTIKQDIYDAWRSGAQNVLAVMPTGAGKTVTFSDIVHEHCGNCCVIAHRKELVCQMSLAMARAGVFHRVIGPNHLVSLVNRIHTDELGRSFYHPNAPVAVASVDTLIRRTEKLGAWCKSVTLWVLDECFPAGTMIGDTPIEQIKVGDVVDSYDEHSGCIVKKPVTRIFKNSEPDEMICIVLQSHHVLRCTKNHPILTKRGWKNAEKITGADELYMVWNTNGTTKRSRIISLPKNRNNLLSKILRLCIPKFNQETSCKTDNKHYLFMVWYSYNNIRNKTIIFFKYWSSILFERLFQFLPYTDIIGDNVQNESKIRISKNDKKESHAQKRNQTEGVGHTEKNRSSTPYERRKWSPCHEIRTKIIRNVWSYWFRKSTHCLYRLLPWCEWDATTLQNRLWKPIFKNSNRSRWVKSFFSFTKSTRQEKRQFSPWTRVESVSIYKPRDNGHSGDGFVYNLEVDDTHTYTANGIVVHNCHHALTKNKWGKAIEMFPNAKGLGVTATPSRTDGAGLGRHADSFIDVMVQGPSQRELINQGYLSDYKIYAPPPSIDVSLVKIGSNGDFTEPSLRREARKSKIVGDVVQHYQSLVPGKLTVVFATDVQTSQDMAKQFMAAGIPAAALSADTPDEERFQTIKRFRKREILVLINVALFDEGFDLPAMEAMIDASPTMSFGRFIQRCGRVLRTSPGKTHGIIVDAAGNVSRHARVVEEDGNLIIDLCARVWTLDRQDKKTRGIPDDAIPIKTCDKCLSDYAAVYAVCPYCGNKPIPLSRSGPEWVAGDLTELDPMALAELLAARSGVDASVKEYLQRSGAIHLAQIPMLSAAKRHRERQAAQIALRESIGWWAAWQNQRGRSDSEGYRRFYYKFGTDVLSAQSLNATEANKLKILIDEVISKEYYLN